MSKLDDYYKNKIAVVTGAGSGIGRAIARLLAASGARVHCADINLAAAEATATEIVNGKAYALDVADAEAVAALAEEIYAAEGRVDLLFNNAGIGYGGLVVDTELADWRRQLDVNVMGVVHGIHAFLPRMQQQGSRCHIINTASGAGIIPLPRMAPYCAAKHAVVGLSQSLASEIHGGNVGITILCPGTINTGIVGTAQMRGESAAQTHASAVDYYAKHGTSPDGVARDALQDVFKGRLFCVTPRREVGPPWLLHRLSPNLVQKIIRRRDKAIRDG